MENILREMLLKNGVIKSPNIRFDGALCRSRVIVRDGSNNQIGYLETAVNGVDVVYRDNYGMVQARLKAV